MIINKLNMGGIKLPLLMTASVSTHGMVGACFTDEQREKMYEESLQFYCSDIMEKDQDQTIVFAENSDWDISIIKSAVPEKMIDRVEFLSFPHKAFDISRGKGYNEAKLIDGCIKSSRFIKNAGGFFKVTGRYPIYNISYFIKTANKRIGSGCQFYGDVKDHKLYDRLRLGWNGHSLDCRIFASTNEFWEKAVSSNVNLLDDYRGLLLEDLMFKNIRHAEENRSLRFGREPHFGGLEGSDVDAISFSKDQDSIKSKVKRFVGNGIRLCLPWFWF